MSFSDKYGWLACLQALLIWWIGLDWIGSGLYSGWLVKERMEMEMVMAMAMAMAMGGRYILHVYVDGHMQHASGTNIQTFNLI